LYGVTPPFAYVTQKPSPFGDEKPPVAKPPQLFAAPAGGTGAAGTATSAAHASTDTRIALRARIVAQPAVCARKFVT
jgi:hypothetical protein